LNNIPLNIPNQEYYLSIIIFNIFVYIVLIYNLFSIFFVFDVKYVKSLTDLKSMNYVDGITSLVIITFLSLAGIPPLLGFVSKFLLFIFFLIKNNPFILALIVVFNLFVMFFYLQNIRYMVSKSAKNYFNFKNNYVYLNKNLLVFISLLNLTSITGIFLANDIIIVFLSVYSYSI